MRYHTPPHLPHHPQANGIVERINGTSKEALKKVCNQERNDWAKDLPLILLGYTGNIHEVTKLTQAEVLYDFKVCLPVAATAFKIKDLEDADGTNIPVEEAAQVLSAEARKAQQARVVLG